MVKKVSIDPVNIEGFIVFWVVVIVVDLPVQ
jgi:hypothetical protein